MNNIEFCNLVREAREISGIKTIDIVIALRKSSASLFQLLKPKCDYNIEKYLKYLGAIGFCIIITNQETSVEITNSKNMREWFVKTLNGLNMSQNQLGELLNTTPRTIRNIMNDGPIRLSVFLKLAELTNSKVFIEAII